MNEKTLSKIRSLRLENGMMQKTLAGKIGVSQPYYCQVETGAKPPSRKFREKFAKVFGLSWEEDIAGPGQLPQGTPETRPQKKEDGEWVAGELESMRDKLNNIIITLGGGVNHSRCFTAGGLRIVLSRRQGVPLVFSEILPGMVRSRPNKFGDYMPANGQ